METVPTEVAAAGASDPTVSSLARAQSLRIDSSLAAEIFDHFCAASTLKSILRAFRLLCETTRLKPAELPQFYPRLKSRLRSWRANAIWAKFDKRLAHKVYKGGRACAGRRVLVIGAGPCGLRTAIEAQLLGAKVVVLEKRDRYSRNNVLHLWPYNIADLRGLGAKKFYGRFCAGAIDHISIRQLQCILLKAALLLGVEVFESVAFEGLVEPSGDEKDHGWRAAVSPVDHPVSQYEFDVLVGADGKRNTLGGFRRKEFRGKLAIAITANFINRHSEEESRVEEISGVAFIFNQKFFNDLNEARGISLENIVYYKDETHYFVMTAKKSSLLQKGVILKNEADTAKLLAPENINQEALFEYAREAADYATNYKLPKLEFAVNHYGKPDVAMFDFTSMFQAENSCRVIECHGHRLLTGLVGDSLLEPFWPTGTGCARGFFGGLDLCWLMRALASGKQTLLEALAERESIYRILNQTTAENTCKDYASYTVDPQTRYPTLNKKLVLPCQVTHLIETDNPSLIEEELALANSSAAKQLKEANTTANHTSVFSAAKKKRRHGAGGLGEDDLSPSVVTASADTLLGWFQRQLESYDCMALTDMTYSFQSGLALCAIIHRYRPELVDFQALDPAAWAENCQLAFDILEHDLGIPPALTGAELANSKSPDKLTMISYLSQVYELFRKDIPAVKQPRLEGGDVNAESDDDLLDSHYRHNHPTRRQQPAGAKRRQHDSNKMSIGQLVASDALQLQQKRKKRKSKEGEVEEAVDDDDMARGMQLDKENNIRETLRMNRSAHKKRMQKLQERAEASEHKHKKVAENERRSIKKDERFKAIEEQFGGSRRRHHNDSISKYRENKKPKDLKRAIGKLDKGDWNIRNIEEKMVAKHKPEGVNKDKVPKWSKAAFQDKFNIMKGKLEAYSEVAEDTGGGAKYADIDSSLARLQRKLREGSALETGTRGANKVAALAEGLFPEEKTPQPQPKEEEKPTRPEPSVQKQIKGASETCHFCAKRVYVVERMSSEGKFFHRSCFRCDYCSILLRLGGYVYHREGPFEGKFFCIPHSTDYSLEKYRYRRKADELRDTENRQRELKVFTTDEWGLKKDQDKGKDFVGSLSDRHKRRLLSHDRRGSTPERAEFEASMESEEEAPSIMDEDEWTDRNFGNSLLLEDRAATKRRKEQERQAAGDTSEDSVSDLDTDTGEEDEDGSGADGRAEEEDGGPASRPLTADEARQLQREWIKKYDPAAAIGDKDRDISSSSESSLDEEDENDDGDYDGEYESSDDSSDSGDSNSGADSDRQLQHRPANPPLPPQRRHYRHYAREILLSDRQVKNRKREAIERCQDDSTEESDTSTEVGSEDLSSAEDDDSEDEVSRSSENSSSSFSSGSATECEFTDSEGRPNPFHKELEEGGRIIGPESPGASRRLHGQQKVIRPDGTIETITNNSSYDPSFASKYQYKTPNLSDRLNNEQKKSTTVIQDFSTRKALSLKKNWVSDASATGGGSNKDRGGKIKSSEVDNRLKSLMERLSSQQKLLKPAEKPSTEMQHFLSATSQGQQPTPKSSSSLVNGCSDHSSSSLKSPPIVASTAVSSSSSLRMFPTPPVYRSIDSQEVSPTSAGNNKKEEEIKKRSEDNENKDCAVKGNESSSPESKDIRGEVQRGENAVKTSDVVIEKDGHGNGRSLTVTKEPVADHRDTAPVTERLNESGSSVKEEDDFRSCDEGGEEAQIMEVEAVNTSVILSGESNSKEDSSVLMLSESNDNFGMPESVKNICGGVEEEDKPPEIPSSLPPDDDEEEEKLAPESSPAPLADSSPVAVQDEIALIDDGVMEPPPQTEVVEKPSRPVFSEDDVTKILRERDPYERAAKLNSYKQKERSVVHDLILAKVGQQRSSSIARKTARFMPVSGPPPPPKVDDAGVDQSCPTRPPQPKQNSNATISKVKLTKEEEKKTEAEAGLNVNNFPLIDDDRQSGGGGGISSVQSTPVKRMDVAATRRLQSPPSVLAGRQQSERLSRPGRPEPTPTVSLSPCNDGLATSPVGSNCSAEIDSYMDGIVSSTDESAPKNSISSSSGSNKANSTNHKDKRTFMKTISGIFSRSSSLSSSGRNPRSLSASEPLNVPPPPPASGNNGNKTQQQQNNFRFPRLSFSRSASAHRGDGKSRVQLAVMPRSIESPQGEAPRADISELGSLPSLSSSISKQEQQVQQQFRPGSLQLHTSHPSTPPIPLSRKITIESIVAAHEGMSENEENESPETSWHSDSHKDDYPPQKDPNGGSSNKSNNGNHQVPPEIVDKIIRRGGKAAKRQARVAQVKRVRRAQEIQRQLEELDEQHRDLEERGIRTEKSLRGEDEERTGRQEEDPELMRSWFELLSEKNRLVRREQELLVQAKQLELEDRSARLEAELREHLALDSRSPESVLREGEVLKELLEISEHREKLQAMLERDRKRYQQEDRDIEAQMLASGIRPPVRLTAQS